MLKCFSVSSEYSRGVSGLIRGVRYMETIDVSYVVFVTICKLMFIWKSVGLRMFCAGHVASV